MSGEGEGGGGGGGGGYFLCTMESEMFLGITNAEMKV